MTNFKVVIGIEIHTVINTNAKMFSNAKSDYNAPSNTLVSFMDLALPGILPIINKKVIDKAIVLADALNMKINYKNIQFDRKNYFYPDLSKGFQITQQYFPIGQNGYINITLANQQTKKITIERIHIEEDTAKQINQNNQLFLDYNRAGCPLIEIVSTPCINSAQEAMEYLHELKRILTFKNISLAQMENGLLRADVNLSIHPIGSKTYGTRVEIKNINSISNVGKAIEYEIKRQQQLLISGKEVIQETRKYNDTLNITESLRAKTDATDYRYMTEPNIIVFQYSEKTIKEIISLSGPSLNEMRDNLFKNGLDNKQINFLLDNIECLQLFLSICSKVNNYLLVFNWINSELLGVLNKTNILIKDLTKTFIDEFANLLLYLDEQKINSKQAKILLLKLLEVKKTIKELIDELCFKQIEDETLIGNIIEQYINNNLDLVNQYPQRPERVEKFLVGMVMKETNSQANPIVTRTILLSKLSKFK